MASQFVCLIDLDHAEFEGDEMIFPLRRCLLKICQDLESGSENGWYPLEGKIIGENGDTVVGHWNIASNVQIAMIKA